MKPILVEVPMQIDEVGRVHLFESVPLLRPEERVVELMLGGWRNQQLSRNLQFSTIDRRVRCVQRFIDHSNEEPWNWTTVMVEEFSADLRSVRHVTHATLRVYHSSLRAFCSYICDPDYGWDRSCEQLFDAYPAQAFSAWNTASHVQEYDARASKRPYTKDELQALFEYADDEVARIGATSKKGWQAAYRDATMMKVA